MKKIVLEHEKPSHPAPGYYFCTVSLASGSVTLQIPNADDDDWQPMTDGVFSAAGDCSVYVSSGGIRASIIGDGGAFLERIN